MRDHLFELMHQLADPYETDYASDLKMMEQEMERAKLAWEQVCAMLAASQTGGSK